MSVYQRSERWMVYYHDDLGKRHDKSFGRGELGRAKAEAFEKAVQEANEKLLPIPDPETVTAGITVVQKIAEVRTEATAPPANQVIEKESVRHHLVRAWEEVPGSHASIRPDREAYSTMWSVCSTTSSFR